MTFKYYLFLFLLSLTSLSVVATFQIAPGYMDADYYFAGGIELATGHGFSEPFLWNYLDDPQGLPHPSHAYWMPLASILAAASMWLGGIADFSTARVGFLIMAGLVSPLTAALAFSLTRKRNSAILAGLLAAFAGFYLPFLPTTDTFGVYMLLGGLFFLLLSPRSPIPFALTALCLGLLAGLMHLSRADGLLWLAMALIAVPFLNRNPHTREHTPSNTPVASRITPHASRIPPHVSRLAPHPIRDISLAVLGYLIIMGPWMLRNLAVFRTLFSPGGSRALWITNYDQLYAYPASLLTPAHWLSSGLGSIITARLWALGQNLQTVLAVQGEIFVAPLIVLGLWHLWQDPRVKIGGLAWLGIFLAMTLVFPFQGTRGGFFHSGAALQPLWWALAPVGLDSFLRIGVRKRGWQMDQASRVFSWGLVGLIVLLTFFVSYAGVVGNDNSDMAWNQTPRHYSKIEASLGEYGIANGEIVMVNNPPGYFVASRRPAIVVPDGGIDSTLAAARRYQARYLILEFNHPKGLNDLYQKPQDLPGLDYLYTLDDTHIFKIASVP
jgi:hypothetical protein